MGRHSLHSLLGQFPRPVGRASLAYLLHLVVLTLVGIARIRLTNTRTNNTNHPQVTPLLAPAPPTDASSHPLPRVTVILSPITARPRHSTRFQSSHHPLTRTLHTGHFAVGA